MKLCKRCKLPNQQYATKRQTICEVCKDKPYTNKVVATKHKLTDEELTANYLVANSVTVEPIRPTKYEASINPEPTTNSLTGTKGNWINLNKRCGVINDSSIYNYGGGNTSSGSD